ncbi:MAG: response regulator [Chlorobiaceae bacterium]|nr:response regulator [Chlorobiaceae bacterium]
MNILSEIVVLFVDDEQETINALKRFLRKEPYTKLFAGSGAEVLDLLQNRNVDILVSDAIMPNMSGQELIRAVKTLHPEIICLLTSGANEAEQIVKSIGIDNVFGFIKKPILPDQFKQAIDDAIEYCFRKGKR